MRPEGAGAGPAEASFPRPGPGTGPGSLPPPTAPGGPQGPLPAQPPAAVGPSRTPPLRLGALNALPTLLLGTAGGFSLPRCAAGGANKRSEIVQKGRVLLKAGLQRDLTLFCASV